MTLYRVFQAGSAFLHIVQIAIALYAVMSWFMRDAKLFRWLEAFISPFIAPFRPLGLWFARRFRLPFDLTCVFAVLGIEIVDRLWLLLYRLLRLLR